MTEVAESRAREMGGVSRYALYSVFKARRGSSGLPEEGRDAIAAEVDDLCEQAAVKGVVTRGVYQISAYRADADYLFWWHGESPDDLQEVYNRFLRTQLGRASDPTWSAIGVFRMAEFNKAHIPAFIRGEKPRAYGCFYPYLRSLDWYLLDPRERNGMLAEHGKMGREFTKDVLANGLNAFALGDYEFLLSYEADDPSRLVDMMRYLRESTSRRHTRLETPLFTGPRRPIAEIVAALP